MSKTNVIFMKTLSESFGVSPRTVRRWVEKGMPFNKTPGGKFYFKVEDVEEWTLDYNELKKPHNDIRETTMYLMECVKNIGLMSPEGHQELIDQINSNDWKGLYDKLVESVEGD